MLEITDGDRKAAEELRVVLADISGFWHIPGDEGPICTALARYRIECEQQLLDKIKPIFAKPGMIDAASGADESALQFSSGLDGSIPVRRRFVGDSHKRLRLLP